MSFGTNYSKDFHINNPKSFKFIKIRSIFGFYIVILMLPAMG